MRNFISLMALACLLCSCGPLYYGYLPGTDYKILKPENAIDLHGKAFNIEVRDGRGTIDKGKVPI